MQTPPRRSLAPARLALGLCAMGWLTLSSPPAHAQDVSARGRLEPRNGARRIAGPSDAVAVVKSLLVEEGDVVRRGQTIAMMDMFDLRDAAVQKIRAEMVSQEAAVARQKAEAENARQELERAKQLAAEGVGSVSDADRWENTRSAALAALLEATTRMESMRASLRAAEADRDRAVVRSPLFGRVLRVHARAGERVGPEGIAEIGETGAMYAVAEVYETDIPRVAKGQRATISSPALGRPLTGVVERVGLKVGRLSAVGADPAARNDARAVEVKIKLDDSKAAAALVDLEVDIVISTRAR
ncbi:MAG: HlyD family efflux transporter periplasmic adaptor subunit [Vicinamibacteria bacterium]|jgi:HlyD family secretion protein|nr:HlyD family efflux transporter periplasmic adaptor subunit [Vicinamibacteria bacterium]MBP9945357.1 HlyD family efflux transporter periplasmic adaptor subunit [Vicinamibacteria bacterium]